METPQHLSGPLLVPKSAHAQFPREIPARTGDFSLALFEIQKYLLLQMCFHKANIATLLAHHYTRPPIHALQKFEGAAPLRTRAGKGSLFLVCSRWCDAAVDTKDIPRRDRGDGDTKCMMRIQLPSQKTKIIFGG